MYRAQCFICGKKVRLPYFPYNLLFWIQKGNIYKFTLENSEGIFEAGTLLCPSCFTDSQDKTLVTDTLILSRIDALRKQRDDYED